MNINWRVRIANKNFWLALIPALALFFSNFVVFFNLGVDLPFLEKLLVGIIDSLFAVLTILGVVNDPTTEGLSDSAQAMTYVTPKGDN